MPGVNPHPTALPHSGFIFYFYEILKVKGSAIVCCCCDNLSATPCESLTAYFPAIYYRVAKCWIRKASNGKVSVGRPYTQ